MAGAGWLPAGTNTAAVGRSLPPLIYGKDHPYGIPFTGSGTEESVNSISTADLEQFQADWLRPDNARIFVVGDTAMRQVLPMLESAFGNSGRHNPYTWYHRKNAGA